jgi:hypothetical protein
LQRRGTRLEKIAEVKAELEQSGAERYAQEQANYAAKVKAREAKEQERGRKPGGKKPPKAPEPGPQAKDQANFTDGDSGIMPTASGPSVKLRTGFEQTGTTHRPQSTSLRC